MIYVTGRWKLYEPADIDHGPVTLQLVTGNLVTATVSFAKMATAGEDPSVTVFREYLRIKTVQPNPDYGKCSLDLILK